MLPSPPSPIPPAARSWRVSPGEATVMELAEPFRMTQPAISHHLKVLEEAGLIVQRVEGSKRPCRLAKAGWKPWINGWPCCAKLWRKTTTGWTSSGGHEIPRGKADKEENTMSKR